MKSAVVLAVALLFLALLASCASSASGVRMTAQEQAACQQQGCSAWTLTELRALVSQSFRAGHAAGYKAGAESL